MCNFMYFVDKNNFYIVNICIIFGASPEYEDTFHLLSLAVIMATLNNSQLERRRFGFAPQLICEEER